MDMGFLNFFTRKNKGVINVYISLSPEDKGGGANSFAHNFVCWLKARPGRYIATGDIARADKAVVIADKADMARLEKAKKAGVFIIHRLDEYFEEGESEFRKAKHKKIMDINKFSDITVYQSQFVCDNVQPYLQAKRFEVIINGADPKLFYPSGDVGQYIGHVSWSADERKRYDLLCELIRAYPNEKFLLVGNHAKTKYSFERFPNATLIGSVTRNDMIRYYHKMTVLYLPSENDPCPNTAVEAVMAGVPVCYNPNAGTKEIVKDCGLPLDNFEELLKNFMAIRQKCLMRKDLYFDVVAERYMAMR